uniref:Uncharacterized protein n=1 Tax=Anguilla anguilla TaxID=7936 RepID=A0A0E9XDN8_ANGAN
MLQEPLLRTTHSSVKILEPHTTDSRVKPQEHHTTPRTVV